MIKKLFSATEAHSKAYPKRLNKAENRRLFFSVAFPIHLWTIYQVFNDLEWIAARTQPTDALGYAGYSMAFALLESLLVYAVIWLAGLISPQSWQGKQFTAISVWTFWNIFLWIAVEQIFLTFPNDTIPTLIEWMFSTGHPLWAAYPLAAVVGTLPIALSGVPLLTFIRSEESWQNFDNFLERISLLTMLLIGIDLLGLVIVLIRNLTP